MYKLYKGAFGEYPEDKDIVAVCGDNWIKMVNDHDLEVNPFIRVSAVHEDRFIDFGSWSYFVLETKDLIV